MIAFFCVSKHEKDIFLSSAIVSGIAKKLNTKQTLFVKSVPAFSTQYPDVLFNTELPQALLSYRRSIHEDVIVDGDVTLINTWIHQLRDNFIDVSQSQTMVNVAESCIAALGLRKKISAECILGSCADQEPKDLNTNRKATVCLTKQVCDNIDTQLISQITSSLSRFDFVVRSNNKIRSTNSHHVNTAADLASYMKSCDVIIATSQHELIPFFNVVNGRKIFLLGNDDTHLFKDIKMFEKTTESVSNLIRDLRGLAT